MTFSISKIRKIDDPILSNPVRVTTREILPIRSNQNSKIYSNSIRTSMLGHLALATGCTNCPGAK